MKPIREHMILVGQLVVIFLALHAGRAVGQDWEDCSSDLDDLRRAASDASDAADEAVSAHDELESCTDDPDAFDLFDDNCESQRSDYDDAVSNLESELDTVVSRFRSVQISCELGVVGSSAAPQGRAVSRECALILRFKDKVPAPKLRETCVALKMTEADCRRCLEQVP